MRILCNERNAEIRQTEQKFIQKDEVQGLRSCRNPEFTRSK